MTHIHVLEKPGKKVFIYDLVELANWYKAGYKAGINGMLLYEKTETHVKYFGFGTSEKPNTECEFNIIPLEDIF